MVDNDIHTSVYDKRDDFGFPIIVKGYFELKCILSYYVPVQTIVSPYDTNCVTPLIYPTTDLDFLFGIIVSFVKFLFFIVLKPAHNLFVNGIIPSLLLP